jgi:glycosyltransferase involved in cell wall biosynthesis
MLIDLFLDLSASRYALRPPAIEGGSFVLHGLTHFDTHLGFRSRGRSALSAHGLRRLTRDEATIVVHTDAARERLARLDVDARVLPVPVAMQESLKPAAPHDEIREPFVLYIGDRRPEKGFESLLAALDASPMLPLIVVAGAGPVTRVDPRIREVGFVNEDRLAALIGAAAAVVLPYTKLFEMKAAASSVAIQALVAGSPLVAPRWMLGQLAPAEQAIEPFDDEPDLLAEAIARSVDAARERRALLAGGVADRVAVAHSFESYTGQLLEWAGRGA